jgi:hypothetical protein
MQEINVASQASFIFQIRTSDIRSTQTHHVSIRVNRTGPETVGIGPTSPDRFRFRPVPNRSKFKIWISIQKMKNSHKILKNTSRCVESNGVKNFQIFVCLV